MLLRPSEIKSYRKDRALQRENNIDSYSACWVVVSIEIFVTSKGIQLPRCEVLRYENGKPIYFCFSAYIYAMYLRKVIRQPMPSCLDNEHPRRRYIYSSSSRPYLFQLSLEIHTSDVYARMSSIDPISLIALIVSLVALVATAGQLLQQYFATADGYRRCQRSVMGPRWAAQTKLQWRWREFRFETLYCVPKLSVAFLDDHDLQSEISTSRIWNETSEKQLLDTNTSYLLTGEYDVSPKDMDIERKS